ncbi:MAG: hypothetical protein IH987_02120 [Planctomycetes bacterium]|nr:hypothetical protein [Planctomycetota bacterium]
MFPMRRGPVSGAHRATANPQPGNASQSSPRNQSRRRVRTTRGIAPPTALPRRQRFTKDDKESEQLYRRSVIERYDDSVDIIVRDGSALNGYLERTLPSIANTLIQHDEGRVRPDGSPRTGGTISLLVFHDNRHQLVNILHC